MIKFNRLSVTDLSRPRTVIVLGILSLQALPTRKTTPVLSTPHLSTPPRPPRPRLCQALRQHPRRAAVAVAADLSGFIQQYRRWQCGPGLHARSQNLSNDLSVRAPFSAHVGPRLPQYVECCVRRSVGFFAQIYFICITFPEFVHFLSDFLHDFKAGFALPWHWSVSRYPQPRPEKNCSPVAEQVRVCAHAR